MQERPRLVVVSPFVDKCHGTERHVAEWLTSLAHTFEIHLYSQRVDDLDMDRITWHRVSKIPGPHLLNFLWWFVANHLGRAWDRRIHNLRPSLVFSPGINCLDADVMSVHVIFAEYRRKNAVSLRLGSHRPRNWPVILHRRFYYSLVAFLERHVYGNPRKSLVLIARRTASALETFCGRTDNFSVVYQGINQEIFNPAARLKSRDLARDELKISPAQFALLLIGNDWKNKGLPVLLEAIGQLQELPLRLLVVGQDNPSYYSRLIEQSGSKEKVQFLPPRKDVQFYYSASDMYIGPSLEDTFARPPAEAMACGLPVITSVMNGTSEIISDGVDGILISDPTDSKKLASLIQRLYEDQCLRERMGAKAAEKMRQFTWERSGHEMTNILLQVLEKKNSLTIKPLGQDA